MSTRCLLASGLMACAVLGFVSPKVRAADQPAAAAQSPVWTGLVPDDALAAVVLYPKRVLANPALAKFDIKGTADDLAKDAGFSPLELEQVAMLVGAPGRAGPLGREPPQIAFIGRFSKLQDSAALAAKWLKAEKTEEVEIAGHKCLHWAKDGRRVLPNEGPAVCFLDGQRFVMASETWMPSIFAATDAKSKLISAMGANDPAADAIIVVTGAEAAKAIMDHEMPAKALPGPLKPIADLPGLVNAARFSVRTNPEISLKLSLTAKDEASADKIDQTIKSLQQLGEAFLPALQVPLDEKLPAEQRESREYATGLATKLIEGLVPHLAGKQVTVEIDKLGTVDAIVGKVLLPAINSARSHAERIQDTNNVKQLGLSMLECVERDGVFPAHAVYSKERKPLLSWRVYVLPFLDEKQLFEQFHLDEPWDSPNNKPLIAKMPAVFKSAGGRPLAEGQTRYVVPVGKNTIFDGDVGVAMSKITDGASYTILILEVGEDKAVAWTKPDDMNFDPQKPLAGLGAVGDDDILAAFADGSVHRLPKDIDAETFRRLIIRNDGLPVDIGNR